MIVLRRWPAWNGFAMFGEENSTITRLPRPDVLEPYEGRFCPSASTYAPSPYVIACTVASVSAVSVFMLTWYSSAGPCFAMRSTYAFGVNASIACACSSSTLVGRRKRGSTTLKSASRPPGATAKNTSLSGTLSVLDSGSAIARRNASCGEVAGSVPSSSGSFGS